MERQPGSARDAISQLQASGHREGALTGGQDSVSAQKLLRKRKFPEACPGPPVGVTATRGVWRGFKGPDADAC